MAFINQATLAEDAVFRSKVRVAAVTAGIDVAGETPINNGQVDEKRQRLAQTVLVDGCTGKLDAFVWACVANPAITGASTDGDIQFTVNSIFSDLAGVTGAELL